MSLLRFFRRRPPAPAPQPQTTALAMVLLPHETGFDAVRALEAADLSGRDLPEFAEPDTQDGITFGRIPGGRAGLAHMPIPIPAADLEGPTQLAWYWPEAAAAAAAHRSHVIVHGSSTELDPLTLRRLVAQLAAAVARTSGGTGVYVGDACMLRSAEDYAAQAESASSDAFPLLLWTSFNLVNDPPGLSAYSMGMTAFGHLELEARHSRLDPPDLLGRLADAAYYQVSSGRVLRDGDTFGVSAAERIGVRHRESAFLPERTVAVLDL